MQVQARASPSHQRATIISQLRHHSSTTFLPSTPSTASPGATRTPVAKRTKLPGASDKHAIQYWRFIFIGAPLPDPSSLSTFFSDIGARFVFQEQPAGMFKGRLDLGRSKRKHVGQVREMFQGAEFQVAYLTLEPETNSTLCSSADAFYITPPVRVRGPWTDDSYQSPRIHPVYEGIDLACMQTPLPWQAWAMAELALPADDRGIVCKTVGLFTSLVTCTARQY